MKAGDRIKMINYITNRSEETIYTIIEVLDESIKVKHPSIGGFFIFRKDRVAEVIE